MERKSIENLALGIGIVGMVLTVVGIYLEPGMMVQKFLFLIGAALLIASAIMTDQKMYIALTSVVLLGTILGFVQGFSVEGKYIVIGVGALIALVYLAVIGHFRRDPWAVLGCLGLIFVGAGYAVDAVSTPLLFNAALAGGSLAVAIYSLIRFFFYGIKVAMVWVVLNVIFLVAPLSYLLTYGY
jgi:hypothetical protein